MVREAVEQRAAGVPYEETAAAFLAFERWTGDDPLLLLAEAAASSTGQGYVSGVRSAVDSFREAFLENGRVETYADLAGLAVDDADLEAALGAERKRRILLEGARALADRPEDDDLAALRGWAETADPYRHGDDPIGAISGVGPATFQYFRMLAGVDAVRPDAHAAQLVNAIGNETDASLETGSALETLAACEWLAIVTDYRRIDIDQIAWWTDADENERTAIDELL